MSDGVNEIDRQAAEWLAKVDDVDPSPEVKAELDAWLAADIRHRGAYLRAQVMMAEVEQHGFALRARFRSLWNTKPVGRRHVLVIGGAIAAVLLVSVFAGLKFLGNPVTSYSTVVGEKQMITLVDGSYVSLNTDTKILVGYSRGKRHVSLVQGEAVFNVAKDKQRPFEVISQGVSIRAVGTKFSVRSVSDQPLEVRVLEGIVRVERGDAQPTVELRRNMRAVVRSGLPAVVSIETPEEMEQDLAWRDGYIILRHRTVASAAQEFSRYSRTLIVIDDPVVARQNITGSYATDDPVGFAKAVALAFNLDVTVKEGEVRLTSKLH